MHKSLFSYNLSRPYPYRWFTWVVVFGGIVAAALLSIINLAADGYEPSTVYVTDPNSVESPTSIPWYLKKPWSQAAKVPPKCQDQTFTVGSQFYTNNFGLSYQLSRILGSSNKPQATFSYHNEYLRDCSVGTIRLVPNPSEYSPFGLDVTADINCTLFEDDPIISIELTLSAHFELEPHAKFYALNQGGTPTFLIASAETQPDLWWSTIFISSISELLNLIPGNDLIRYDFEPDTKDTIVEDMETEDRVYSETVLVGSTFQLGYAGKISTSQWTSKFGSDVFSLIPARWNDSSNAYAVNATTSDNATAQFVLYDSLAKLIYVTILSDLGQFNDANILGSAKRTLDAWNATARFTCVLRSNGTDCVDPWSQWGTTSEVFPQLGNNKSIINPATISTQYTCQVPKLKSRGSLVISVIVADVVLLQVLWKVLNWATTLFLGRRHSDSSYCSGCAKHLPMIETPRLNSNEDLPTQFSLHHSMTSLSPSTKSSRPYEPLPNVVTRPLSINSLLTSTFTDTDQTPYSRRDDTSMRSLTMERGRRISDEESPPSPL